MTFGERLEYFIENYYSSKKDFADDIGIPFSSLSRYIADRSAPTYITLEAFAKVGISIDWLLTGEDNCWRANIFELALDNPNIKFKIDVIEDCYKRAFTFIKDHYQDIESLAYSIDVDEDHIVDLLSQKVPDPELLKLLNKIGCNVIWFYTGKGTIYSDTVLGYILKKTYSDFEARKNDLKGIDSIDDFYKIIRIAVQSVINPMNKFKGNINE